MKRPLLTLSLAGLGIAVLATTANANMYSFTNVTSNSAQNAASGGQYHVDVTNAGGGFVDFMFTNDLSLIQSSITQIYFDDGSLFGISQIFQSAGVSYTTPGSPPNLPGGNGIDFNTTSGFLAVPAPPVQPNGVNNANEFVTIRFQLMSGATFSDTINAISLGMANPGVDMPGGLRMGIHVQGFPNGGSESFVNTPVPAPGAALLGMLGLAIVNGFKRRSIV